MIIKTFKLTELTRPAINPNRMSDEQAGLLRNAIGSWDYLQPIIVNVRGGAREIVDGEHRLDGLESHGYTEAQCVVVDLPPDKVRALRLAMNRLRGEVDLRIASDIVRDLQGDGWGDADLTLTGFLPDEIAGLLSIGAEDDVLAPPAGATDEPAPPKPFLLEITFSTKEDYQLARRKLRRAAGKGNGLDVGLLNVLGELETNTNTSAQRKGRKENVG